MNNFQIQITWHKTYLLAHHMMRVVAVSDVRFTSGTHTYADVPQRMYICVDYDELKDTPKKKERRERIMVKKLLIGVSKSIEKWIAARGGVEA